MTLGFGQHRFLNLFLDELCFDQNFSNEFILIVHEFEPVRKVNALGKLLNFYVRTAVEIRVLCERGLDIGAGGGA